MALVGAPARSSRIALSYKTFEDQKGESCKRQLKAGAPSIPDSDHKGQRHVNQKTKRQDQAKLESEESLKELAEIQSRNKSPTIKN